MKQKTFEELLIEEMAVPVKITNAREGQPDKIETWRACVIAIKNKAVKGDIQSIMFIRSLTEGRNRDKVDEQAIAEEITKMEQELLAQLSSQGFRTKASVELWLLAKQLLTLRRIAVSTAAPGHQDIITTPQKNGPDKLELSTDNRIYNDLLKQWRTDWYDFQQKLVQSEIRSKMLRQQ